MHSNSIAKTRRDCPKNLFQGTVFAEILALVLLLFAVPGHSESLDFIKHKLRTMTIEQKVEQLLVCGFSGTDYESSLGPRLRGLKPGSFIVFSRNVKTPERLALALEKAQAHSLTESGIPLFFMLDQEGGQVTRIKTSPPSPSALAMGQTQNPDLIKEIGRTTGELLKAIGINMNLAPVLDLADPNQVHFVGNRSFGNQPYDVANYGLNYSQGLMQSEVIPTAKHFPGHGGTRGDSHKGKTRKLDPLVELMAHDLMPFRKYTKLKGAKALMVAHVSYPALDPSGLPATFSKPIITDLLRDQIGYNGLVITDDLEMNGASSVGPISERAVKAIQAGADMIMVAWSLNKQRIVKGAVIDAVKSGRLSEDRINDSVMRVLKAKLQVETRNQRVVRSRSEFSSQIRKGLARLEELSHMVSRINFDKSLTQWAGQLPALGPRTKTHVFTASASFFRGIKKVKRKRVWFHSLRKTDGRKIASVLAKDKDSIGIYYASGSITAKRLRRLPTRLKKRMLVINSTYPGLINNPKDYAGVIHLNTRNSASGEWIAHFLFDNLLGNRLPAKEATYKKTRRRSGGS